MASEVVSLINKLYNHRRQGSVLLINKLCVVWCGEHGLCINNCSLELLQSLPLHGYLVSCHLACKDPKLYMLTRCASLWVILTKLVVLQTWKHKFFVLRRTDSVRNILNSIVWYFNFLWDLFPLRLWLPFHPVTELSPVAISSCLCFHCYKV